jgi:hypothetical protein
MNTHFYCSQVTYAASLSYFELELDPLFRLEDAAIRSAGWCFIPGSNVTSRPLSTSLATVFLSPQNIASHNSGTKLFGCQEEPLVPGGFGMRVSHPNLRTSPPNPTRTRVACRKACNVLAMMPIHKNTATEIRTVATGKELPVQDTGYFTEVKKPLSSRRDRN